MREHILIVSTSVYFANSMMERIKRYDPCIRVTIATNPKSISAAPEKIKADILLLETNCWYGATPVFIAKILEQKKNLTVCVFGYEELPGSAVASFFQHGAVGYLDFRQGPDGVYEGIKKILHGNMYIPERYRERVKNSACGDYNTDSLLTSEYWLCRLICFGLELDTCAEIMKVTLSTARYYKARVYKKLNVHNTASLVGKCRQLGIIKPDDVFQNILSDDEIKIICGRGKKYADEKQYGRYAVVS
ncbi:MAG: hypothetical protein LBP37_06280 [Spirochaetaceae bacterium]|jgi:DNA-binding NarL/FixJ family response regulator|nr:hypothetical protein [Spirochaetaceae bacterium]